MKMVMDKIDEHGWTVVGTITPLGVPFAYTVGLTFHRIPELYLDCATTGLSSDEAPHLLNALAVLHREAGGLKPGPMFPVGEHLVMLIEQRDMTPLAMARAIFGDGVPAHPTALSVEIVRFRGDDRAGDADKVPAP